MAVSQRYLCGVPKQRCMGGAVSMLPGMRGFRSHSSREEAFRCMVRYLESQGYERIGSREFRKEGQPVRVLTKKSRFGARLRAGKEGRFMPKERPSGVVIG